MKNITRAHLAQRKVVDLASYRALRRRFSGDPTEPIQFGRGMRLYGLKAAKAIHLLENLSVHENASVRTNASVLLQGIRRGIEIIDDTLSAIRYQPKTVLVIQIDDTIWLAIGNAIQAHRDE